MDTEITHIFFLKRKISPKFYEKEKSAGEKGVAFREMGDTIQDVSGSNSMLITIISFN